MLGNRKAETMTKGEKISNALKGHKVSNETRRKISKANKGINNGMFKGRTYSKGYIYIYSPYHPFANSSNYVAEHRLIMEKYLKRFLKSEEVVHHINHIRDDNNIKNLHLCSNKKEHTKLHPETQHIRNINNKGKNNPMFGKKGALNPRWKGGNKRNNCLDCGKPIWFSAKRCKSCAMKERYNGG